MLKGSYSISFFYKNSLLYSFLLYGDFLLLISTASYILSTITFYLFSTYFVLYGGTISYGFLYMLLTLLFIGVNSYYPKISLSS